MLFAFQDIATASSVNVLLVVIFTIFLTITFVLFIFIIFKLKRKQTDLLSLIHEKEKAEEELRKSESRFEIAVRGTNDGIWDWDLVTDEVYFSARWKQLLRYKTGEFGDTFSAYLANLHPDDIQNTTDAIEEHINNNKTFDVVHRIKTHEGEYRWFRSRGQAIRNESGKAVRMAGSISDITESKRSEDIKTTLFNISKAINSIQSENELFQVIHSEVAKIIDASNFFIAVYEEKNDEIIFPYFVDENDNSLKITNASKSDSLTMKIIKSQQSLFVNEDTLLKRRNSGTKTYWGAQAKCWIGVPLKIKDKIIGAIALQSYSNPLLYSEKDIEILEAVSEQIAVAIDSRRSEEKLWENQELLLSINQNISEAIYRSTPTKGLVYVNDAFAEMFGYTSVEQALSVPSPFLYENPEDRQVLVKSIVEQGQISDVEIRFLKKDGTKFWGLVSSKAIFDRNGEILYYDGAIKDITERKKTEVEIQNLNRDLEKRIGERTSELVISNKKLQNEITERIRSEEAVRESEERTRLIIDTALDAVITIDAEGTITRWNKQAENTFGWAKEEIIGKLLTETIIPSPYREAHIHGMKKYLDTGVGQVLNKRIEISALHKDGHELPIELSISPVISGDKITFSAFLRDITSRKQSEEALRTSEEKYRLVIENANDAILVAQDGIIKFANPKTVELTGFSVDELALIPFIDLIYKEDKTLVLDRYRARMRGEDVPNVYTFRIVDKKGNLKLIEINAHMLMWEGKPATLNFISDITETKRAEDVQKAVYRISQAIHHTKDLHTLFAHIHGIVQTLMPANNFYIALYDSKTEIISFPYRVDEYDVNSKSRKYGKGITEYILRTGKALLATPEIIEEMKERGEIVQSGQVSAIWLGVPLIIKGNTVGIMAVQDYYNVSAYDEKDKQILSFVSEQVATAIEIKQAEEEIRFALAKEKELGELKSRFISMTSHEFRTPLTSILSTAQLLEQYDQALTPEKKKSMLHRIQVSAKSTTNLLEDILMINKVEAGKIEFNPSEVPLIKFCNDITEEIQMADGTKHAIYFINKTSISNAFVDEKLLRHIITNLLSNAVKYSPKGGNVHFTLEKKNGELIFSVKDEGIGIPEEDQKRLFDTFHRATNVSNIPGTGLGLAIVKRSVELHGGTIFFESKVNDGTKFIVNLPYREKEVSV